MRRPLNWIVVSISLLVLFANRMVADPVPAVNTFQAVSKLPAVESSPSPFAYVREDGTQTFLPVERKLAPQPEVSFEQTHAAQWASAAQDSMDPKAAVYTWSSPVLTSAESSFQ